MSQDSDYLNRYQTEAEIKAEIIRCRGFLASISAFSKRLPTASTGLRLWEHRINMLQAKLLLLSQHHGP